MQPLDISADDNSVTVQTLRSGDSPPIAQQLHCVGRIVALTLEVATLTFATLYCGPAVERDGVLQADATPTRRP